MREQDKQKLIRKISEVSSDSYGETLYFRPFEADDKIIAEIARAKGEKKSAIAQKLLHLALKGKQYDFGNEKQEQSKLDWLINHEKHKLIKTDVSDARLERLEEHAREVEKTLQMTAENSHITSILVSEIYCVSIVCLSLLNQIFTKLIEYFSPVEIEKNNSTDFANRNILGLVEHSLSELEKITEHHGLDLETVEPRMLYLFTKIEKIKERLLPQSIQSNSEQK